MEEKQEQRKKKIAKILKIISIILFFIFLALISIGSCVKTNALSSYDNYGYKYLVVIENKVELNTNYYQCTVQEKGYYNNGQWQNESSEDLRGYEIYIQKVLDVSDGLGISNANVINGNLYMVAGTFDSDVYKIYKITTIKIYLDVLTTDYYNNGYEVAVQDNSEGNLNGAYEQGRQAGKDEVQNNYDQALETTRNQYNQSLQAKDDEIERLTEQLNTQNPAWGSFKSLLGLIVTYPIQIFKEGLNVEIFGVNVGHLILGIAIFMILLTVLSFVLGGKSGGKKE